MKKFISQALAIAGAFIVLASNVHALDFTDNFTANPLANGWQVFGDTNLFQWDAVNHDIAVTWDSSQSNSYFYHPLGTTLSSNSSFTFSFDININRCTITGGSFEIVAGLLNYTNATNAGFLRGTGDNTTNLVEFDFFADPESGNSISASEFDTNGLAAFAYDAVFAWTTNTTYRVTVTYFAGDPMICAQLSSGGYVLSYLPSSFNEGIGDINVDALAIMSYNDAEAYNDTNGVGGVSIDANGTVGNFSLNTSPDPAPNLSGSFTNGVWQAQFLSYPTWSYALQRSTNLQTWIALAALTNGTGMPMTLQDMNPPATQAFYRIQAQHSTTPSAPPGN